MIVFISSISCLLSFNNAEIKAEIAERNKIQAMTEKVSKQDCLSVPSDGHGCFVVQEIAERGRLRCEVMATAEAKVEHPSPSSTCNFFCRQEGWQRKTAR